MKFQTLKRIMCCFMALLILCCAVVRPIEASAEGLGATMAGATVIGISPGIAVAGILAALGIGYVASGDFEELVTDIVENIPADFIIETMSGTEMIEGLSYNDVCYVYDEVVEWVNEYLYTPAYTETPTLSATYSHTGEWADYYKQAVTQHPEVDLSPGNFAYCTYLTYENGSKELVYSNSAVKIKEATGAGFDKFSLSGEFATFIFNDSGLLSGCNIGDGTTGLSWSDDLADISLLDPVDISTTANVTLSDRISSILGGETYASWLAKSLTISDTTTAVPIALGETIAATGAIAQTVAQTAVLSPSITYEKTDDIVYVEVPEVSNDLSGIIALLKAILEVLNNIYQTCAVSIKSWIETNSQAIIDASTAESDAITTTTTAISDTISLIKNHTTTIAAYVAQVIPSLLTQISTAITTGVTDITTAISDAIAEVIAKLAALGLTLAEILTAIQALALSIADAIADVLTFVFVPSAGYFDAKVDALMDAFPFFENAMDTAILLKDFLVNLGSTPPIIYIHLNNATGSYWWGGEVIFLDLRWYADYKPTMDVILSAFLWMWFAWRLILSLPGIIQGTSGFWGQPIGMNPNGYLPANGTVNETGISVKK